MARLHRTMDPMTFPTTIQPVLRRETQAATTLCAAAFALAAFAACREPAKPAPVLDKRHVITVDGSTVRYNGRELDWNVDAAVWQDVLGPCSRSWDNILVWDDLGIFVYQDLYDLHPSTFAVLFGRVQHSPHTEGDPEFWPRTLFSGRFVVDGAIVHKDSTVQEINQTKRPPGFRRAHLDTIYTFPVGQFGLWLEHGYDKTLTLFEISREVRSTSPPDYIARVKSHAKRAGCRPKRAP